MAQDKPNQEVPSHNPAWENSVMVKRHGEELNNPSIEEIATKLAEILLAHIDATDHGKYERSENTE